MRALPGTTETRALRDSTARYTRNPQGGKRNATSSQAHRGKYRTCRRFTSVVTTMRYATYTRVSDRYTPRTLRYSGKSPTEETIVGLARRRSMVISCEGLASVVRKRCPDRLVHSTCPEKVSYVAPTT